LRDRITCGIKAPGHKIRDKDFSGTVAASIAQSGRRNRQKNRKADRESQYAQHGQPTETSTQPVITGITDMDLNRKDPCVLPKNIKTRPANKVVQPSSGAGETIVALIFSGIAN